ncbi:hypothetical protein SAMN05192558_102322 [Actinokineospora alba]|uniref:Capsular polysaccharide biosynthesis protein n=1 Tax=Actinokineospora alba TaxID=504798 RepID=A0A1H0HYK5_9PSEU|nr:hypothetical protein [Actinokineospora alba]TDP64687.1 hypothetical protein C8E96_0156 [Actinokineospora alba]SDI84037.1 hypothetical protein SAMN05421871_10821 [Actinokineospora alba]SDO24292.1 hypothetical protein SAMN05192558_102322 [Actinokineospora alba]
MKAILTRTPLSVLAGLAAGLLMAAVVLIGAEARGEVFEGRVGLLAQPVPGAQTPYGEVVSLGLPAMVELARSPSVLEAATHGLGISPAELAKSVSVELVPASALVRLAVRAPTEAQAQTAVSAIAKAMVTADLLAPAGKLRLVDERAELTRVAPDRPLAFGLALAAGAAATLATATVVTLRRARSVGAALGAAGVQHAVTVVREDDTDLADRLAVLCAAAARPARVVAVAPDLADRADALAERLPDKTGEPGDGSAVIVMVHKENPEEAATVVGLLPLSSVLVAVVLA